MFTVSTSCRVRATYSSSRRFLRVRVVSLSAASSASSASSSSSSGKRTFVGTAARKSAKDGSNATSSNNTTAGKKFATEAELQAYLHEANNTMQKYAETRELMRRGKLKPNSNNYYNKGNTNSKNQQMAQLGIVGFFLAAFMTTPFLGKKIAQDDDFRKRWIPSWYDYTVKKPDQPWTRQELHEQMLQVQAELRQRAIAGEFAPDKLQELKRALHDEAFSHLHERHQQNQNNSKAIPKEWDSIHPGIDEDDDEDDE